MAKEEIAHSFAYRHNVFKSRLLLRHQKVSVYGKALNQLGQRPQDQSKKNLFVILLYTNLHKSSSKSETAVIASAAKWLEKEEG